jgi:hypothetical protein
MISIIGYPAERIDYAVESPSSRSVLAGRPPLREAIGLMAVTGFGAKTQQLTGLKQGLEYVLEIQCYCHTAR